MQFLAASALLAAAVLAVPFNHHHARSGPFFDFNNGTSTSPLPPSSTGSSGSPGAGACSPGAFRCSIDLAGWEVCSALGQYVTAGDCAGAKCQLAPTTNVPFCV